MQVHSHFQAPLGTSDDVKGMHKCGHCDCSNCILEGCTHDIERYVYCQTKGVVYIVFSKCGMFYVGKTFRNFWRQIYDIKKNLLYTPIGRHVALQHRHDMSMVKFTVLEEVMEDPRGGNFFNVRRGGFLNEMLPFHLASMRLLVIGHS